MEIIWLPIALFASFLQTLRNIIMKKLRDNLRDTTIMFARFIFALPFTLAGFFIIKMLGYKIPEVNASFLFYAISASLMQMIGARLFLALFSRRNFVIGITYAKTEAIMAAVFGAILFAEVTGIGSWFSIFLGFAGILLISIVEQHIEPKKLIERIFTPSAIIGISCGTLFGLTAVFIRQAILSLGEGEFFVNASFSLVFMQSLQTFIMLIFILTKGRDDVRNILKVKKQAFLAGFTNSISSISWFMAFSLANAAYVSLVGQAELLFSIFLTHKMFKEKISKMELLGITMLMMSIVLLVYFR